MSPNKEIMLEDRSGALLDKKCSLAYWWNRLEGTRGLMPKETADELRVGTDIHEDTHWAATAEDISPGAIQERVDMIIQDLPIHEKERQDGMERLYRRLGWLVAYALYIEPDTRLVYENVQTEAEIILDRSPLWECVTPDRVMRNRRTGALVYREYKSTISASYKWLSSWSYSIQLHLGMKAIEEELGQKVAFAQIMGLMKGDNKNNHLVHPYVWAWYSLAKDKWEWDYNKARGADWLPRPVWDYPGGIVKWVQFCGDDVARSQFPSSAPVFLNNAMLEDWIGARTYRQRVIREVKDECRSSWESRVIHFPPNLEACAPAFGSKCPYLPLCWNAENRKDPSKAGFIERVPHHQIELTLVD